MGIFFNKTLKETYGDIREFPLDDLNNIISNWEIHSLRLVTAVLAELKRRETLNLKI